MISYNSASLMDQIAELTKDFGQMQRRQVPFALRLAIKRTAEEARDAVRNRIFQRGFRFRTANAVNYLANAIIIERPTVSDSDPSTRTKHTIIAESKAGRSKSRSLLPWLEEGGTRTSLREIGPPGVFGRALAIPVRSSPVAQVPKGMFPAGLRLQQALYTIRRGGKTVDNHPGRLRGKRRTFVLPDASRGRGFATIFQRVGKGPRDLVPLFLVRPSAQVQGRRYFFSTIQRTMGQRFAINFRGAMHAALFSSEIGRNRGVRVGYSRGVVQPTRAW